jgi:hypothetical protein
MTALDAYAEWCSEAHYAECCYAECRYRMKLSIKMLH